jgi:methyl-accepting chemotaxis protein
VVAAEVRNLAQRSADAARQIKQLIGASVDKVKSGTRQVEVAGGTMREVVDSVAQVSALVGEIRAGVGTQAVAVDEIAQSVRQLDRTTRQNADLVEESAAAADSLRLQAQALTEVVAVFRLSEAQVQALPHAAAARQPNEIPPPGEGQLDDMQGVWALR